MWYVNVSGNKLTLTKDKCFILTMWYVNFLFYFLLL